MFLTSLIITKDSFITDIVRQDYRTAGVFRRHGIDFCCGGKWPLGMVCETKDLDFNRIKKELEKAVQNLQVSNSLGFDNWDIDFLTDYIIHVHHQYLRDNLPEIKLQLILFIEDHFHKFPYLSELQSLFNAIYNEMLPHIDEEEQIIFP